MKATRLIPALAPLIVLATPPLEAQEAEPAIIVTPHVGVNLNPSALYRVYAQFPQNNYLPFSEASIGPGVSVGLDLDVVLWQGAPVRLRLSGRQVLFSQGKVDGLLDPLDTSLSPQSFTFDFDAGVTLISTDLVFRPPGDRALREQFVVGLAYKRFGFGELPGDTVGFVFPVSGGSGAMHIGAGVDFPIGGLTFHIGVHDYINVYAIQESVFSQPDSRTQHTILISTGVLFPVGGTRSQSYRVPLPSRR